MHTTTTPIPLLLLTIYTLNHPTSPHFHYPTSKQTSCIRGTFPDYQRKCDNLVVSQVDDPERCP